MKISAVDSYYTHKCSANSAKQCKPSGRMLFTKQGVDTVCFEGKGGKILGGILGGAAGGAAGGAIIGGGSLAALGSVIALGPLGAALAAAYVVGGTLTGGYIGSEIADIMQDNGKDKSGKK